MAMAGIPLIVIAVDVLYTRTFSDRLREALFRPQDTQIFEARDVLYAWLAFAFGLLFVIWGLKELVSPTSVVETTDEGLALRLGSPFSPATLIPWSQILDVSSEEADDEGTRVPLLVLLVRSRDGIPDNPWAGRWLSDDRLGVLADNWEEPPDIVAGRIIEVAREPIVSGWLRSGDEEE